MKIFVLSLSLAFFSSPLFAADPIVAIIDPIVAIIDGLVDGPVEEMGQHFEILKELDTKLTKKEASAVYDSSLLALSLLGHLTLYEIYHIAELRKEDPERYKRQEQYNLECNVNPARKALMALNIQTDKHGVAFADLTKEDLFGPPQGEQPDMLFTKDEIEYAFSTGVGIYGNRLNEIEKALRRRNPHVYPEYQGDVTQLQAEVERFPRDRLSVHLLTGGRSYGIGYYRTHRWYSATQDTKTLRINLTARRDAAKNFSGWNQNLREEMLYFARFSHIEEITFEIKEPKLDYQFFISAFRTAPQLRKMAIIADTDEHRDEMIRIINQEKAASLFPYDIEVEVLTASLVGARL